MYKCLSVVVFGIAICLSQPLTAQTAVETGTIDPDSVKLIEFSVGMNVVSPTFLDITTNGSTTATGGPALTNLLLFSGIGDSAVFLVSDSNDGIALQSTLSFGAGSGETLGDSFNLGGDGVADGEDGDLMSGSFTLVVGGSPVPDPPGGVGTHLGQFLADGNFGSSLVNCSVSFYSNDKSFSLDGGVLLGDLNGDGVIDLLDVVPFVAAITDGDFVSAADINGDGLVDLLDVAPFVELLSGG